MANRASFTRTSGGVITSAWANALRDHLVPYSGATDGTTEGMLSVNTADDTLRIGNGSAGVQFGTYSTAGLSTWTCTSFTQAPSGGSVAMTDARFTRFGPFVVGSGYGQLTTGGFPGPGTPIQFNIGGLPAARAVTTTNVGTFVYHRQGVTYYRGILSCNAGMTVFACSRDSNDNAIGVSPSFSVAPSGHEVWFNFCYIAAAAT